MPDRIHLTVATVVEKDDRFLMVKETKFGRQVINQPAGHVEPGEDILRAAVRETVKHRFAARDRRRSAAQVHHTELARSPGQAAWP